MTQFRVRVSEAEAVVLEAEALERETRIETAELVAGELGWRPGLCAAEDQLQYLRLRDAAAVVVEISYSMQGPLRDDPYASLGSKIIARAKSILADIEAADLYGRPAADEPPSGKS